MFIASILEVHVQIRSSMVSDSSRLTLTKTSFQAMMRLSTMEAWLCASAGEMSGVEACSRQKSSMPLAMCAFAGSARSFFGAPAQESQARSSASTSSSAVTLVVARAIGNVTAKREATSTMMTSITRLPPVSVTKNSSTASTSRKALASSLPDEVCGSLDRLDSSTQIEQAICCTYSMISGLQP